MVEVAFSIENGRGDAVDGDVRYVAGGPRRPVVVMCHGFKGFKDWGPFPTWGRRLAAEGFVSVLFNFSFNGVEKDQPTEFTRLDRFADNTFSRELGDLRAVLDAVCAGALGDAPVAAGCLGLMGHSRGGGTAILTAARDERVKALCTWSSVAGFIERFTPSQIADWRDKGFTEVVNARTGQVMRLNRILYDDALAHSDRLDVLRAARDVDKPWLIVHARDDDAVAFADAERLHEAAPSSLLFETCGGHTFGGSHPFDGTVPEALAAVFDQTLAFFSDVL